jgi:hypothetical protein
MTEATTKRRSRRLYVRNIDGRDEEMVTLSSHGESVSVKVGLLQGLVTLDKVSELRKQAQKEK